MSADIEKLAVFDDRIVQSKARYAVEKGALSLTNAPFSAVGNNSSQQSFNINVPSENVFVDRAVEWTATCALSMNVAISGGQQSQNAPVVVFGRDCALSAFPLQSLTQTLTATINDTTVTMNTGDVLYEVLRLTDYKKNRAQRTCPTYLDTYKSYNSASGAINNPLGDYTNACDSGSVPNGAWYNVSFTDSTGAVLSGSGSYTSGSVTVSYTNGVPVQSASYPSGGYPIFLKFTSTEKLVLSPFVFSDCHEFDTGLFGIQNIQLVLNMSAPSQTATSGRVIRSTTTYGRTISSVAYNGSVSGGTPFTSSQVNVQFLTPSLDLPLPPKSIVPYMEFPRYIYSAGAQTVSVGTEFSVQSQTITLPQIPDLLIVYVKPSTYLATDADWYFPINDVTSINFDNFSGLLSSQTQQQLYAMAFKNGLDMDFNQWVGEANVASQALTSSEFAQGKVGLTGGFLVLKPSQDITLQSGQAPSLVGNFTFQISLKCMNNSGSTSVSPTVYVITANSGFFESIKGSSRIVKGVLSAQDILDAPMSHTRSALTRAVGGKSVLHRLGNVLSKVKEYLPLAKEVAKHAKPHLPEGARDVLSAVGLGRHHRKHAHRLM